jgi:simple sugar transport system ATP-binding protein
MMVGRPVELTVQKNSASAGDVVLKVTDLTVLDADGRTHVENVSFEVRAGEIVGIAGVQGNGQTELVEALTGLRKATGGTISLDGKDLTHSDPR